MDKKRTAQWILCGLLFVMAIFCIAAGCANGINNGTGKSETCWMKYRVSDYEVGWIDGVTDQYIFEGETTTEVVAIAEEGYVFIGWSDGVKTARRQDFAEGFNALNAITEDAAQEEHGAVSDEYAG